MATARQLVSLLSSLNEGDSEQVFSIVLQVAAAEAKRGRRAVADELRVLVEEGRSRLQSRQASRLLSEVVVPITKLRGELQHLLTFAQPQTRLNDLVLPADLQRRLHDVANQQRLREELRKHALTPVAEMLLIGPPGSGKTLTASALAGELHLPLYSVRFDSVITRYMGETAAKLRLIFDQIGSTRGVYLFDEFDAVGGKRNADNDIGEMRRVLNSFLQFLEEPRATDSLVICATNHPELLDRALFRRFDEVLQYSLPTEEQCLELMLRKLQPYGFQRDWWPSLRNLISGLSHADIAESSEDTIKHLILSKGVVADVNLVSRALMKRRSIIDTLRDFSL